MCGWKTREDSLAGLQSCSRNSFPSLILCPTGSSCLSPPNPAGPLRLSEKTWLCSFPASLVRSPGTALHRELEQLRGGHSPIHSPRLWFNSPVLLVVQSLQTLFHIFCSVFSLFTEGGRILMAVNSSWTETDVFYYCSLAQPSFLSHPSNAEEFASGAGGCVVPRVWCEARNLHLNQVLM